MTPDELRSSVAAVFDEMVDTRRAVHAAPELSFAEHRTTALVCQRLDELGLAALACPTSTGAVYEVTGGRPGPTVLLRADLDALPVEERTGVPWSSAEPGVMHACGHDAHTAVLLGVARLLADRRDDLPGRVLLVFQPGEEAIDGALAMLSGGMLEELRPDLVLGSHVSSLLPTGMVALRAGISMAAASSLRAVVTGRGGHGAIDPYHGNVVLAAARLAERMPEVVDGLEFEGTACVCSPAALRAGTAVNVVPERAELLGTLRTFTPAQASAAWRLLQEVAGDVAAEFGVEVDLRQPAVTSAVDNDPGATRLVLDAARQVVDPSLVVEMPSPVPASDDVAEFLRRVPGCYWFVGGQRNDGRSGPHHSPTFDVDEECLRSAATVLASATWAALATG